MSDELQYALWKAVIANPERAWEEVRAALPPEAAELFASWGGTGELPDFGAVEVSPEVDALCREWALNALSAFKRLTEERLASGAGLEPLLPVLAAMARTT